MSDFVAEEQLASLPASPSKSSNAFAVKPLSSIIGEARETVFEGFSKLASYARQQTSQALEHPLARPILPFLPERIRSYFITSDEVVQLLKEYDSAQRYLERFSATIQNRLRTSSQQEPVEYGGLKERDVSRSFDCIGKPYHFSFTGAPLTSEEWRAARSEDGSITAFKTSFFRRIFCGGVEPSIRRDVWKYLLGVYGCDSTTAEREALDAKRKEQYSGLRSSWTQIAAANASRKVSHTGHDQAGPNNSAAVGDEDESGDFETKIVERKYRIEKDVIRTDRQVDFFSSTEPDHVKSPNGSPTLVIEPNIGLTTLRDVLMTYTVYNFELGYVQGMSDLCAPILEVMQNEEETFWCFAAFMTRMV